MMPAHRASYMLHRGPIPVGMQVCHTCDRPACVNPEHLFLGTNKENSEDMFRKGRYVSSPGSSNGFARLDESQVAEIKQKLAQPYHGIQRQLAREYGVDPRTISTISTGVRWRHV